MAEEKEEPKTPDESKVALEELKSSLEDISTKLSEYDTKFEDINSQIKTIPTPTLEEKGDEGYVEKGWVPKDWNEVYAKSDEIINKKVQARFDAFQQEQQKTQEQKAQEEAAINAAFDRQLNQLEKENKIPKITNQTDKNDPGLVARRELFQLGLDYESTNLIKMAELRQKIKKEPEGLEAPVGSSGKTTPPTSSVSYKDLHEKSMDQLVREEMGSK